MAVQEFSRDVTVIDLKSNYSVSDQEYLKSIGVQNSGYAFLIRDGVVVYVNNTIGLDPAQAEQDILKSMESKKLPLVNFLNPQNKINIEMFADVLPTKEFQLLRGFLSKTKVGFVFLDSSCEECDLQASYIEQFKKKWDAEKKKVVFVYSAGENRTVVHQSSMDLYLRKSDSKQLGTDFSKKFNVRGFPEILVVENQKLAGRISYQGLEIDKGIKYNHMYFAVLDKVLSN